MHDETPQTANLNDPLTDQGDELLQDNFKDSLYNPLALLENVFKDLVDIASVHVGLPRTEVLEKTIDDPFLKEKTIASKEASDVTPTPNTSLLINLINKFIMKYMLVKIFILHK